MQVKSNLLRHDVRNGAYLRHRGRTYCVRASGCRALELFRDIVYRPDCQNLTGLLKLRPRIRQLLASTPHITLACLIDTSDEPIVLRLSIWAAGKAGSRYATKSIVSHSQHPDIQVQREVVRALRRLSAWFELTRIAAESEQPEIRQMAENVSLRRDDFSDRLAHYLACTHARPLAAGHAELVLSPSLEVGKGRLPKSGWQIRRTLRRIRLLVRGRHRRRPSSLFGARVSG